MTHHKDCQRVRAGLDDHPGMVGCTCPRDHLFAAYATQGKRIEELERDLRVANKRGDAYYAVAGREEDARKKAEAALGEAVGLLDAVGSGAWGILTPQVRAFLAKQGKG